MKTERAGQIADEILGLYERYGGAEYAGEKVSQLEHMAQAAQLAESQGCDEEVVLAAFLHDIGHICASAAKEQMDGFGAVDHEGIGAEFLSERGFSRKVVRLVESHVEAKRWLTLREPGYYEQLSAASRKTLEYQGGPMDEDEAAAFEQYPLFELIIKMRKWDEQAKVEHRPLPALAHYHDMIVRHLQSSSIAGK
ncbi:MAG: HDIG domain-containing protein [Bacteroidota bacterium]|nr:HDIG domain-containing protein [Bacteroidota bacterium]MDP4215219.1 HDIG domain-containing protein [Bacteroidota bacterium]MDP4246183.1 HDIG domain-containing protein [Bacteroidota bacterium]MDP4254560.1 HDIG domain-containing protein [Bacteroidota bacterium]MDP4260000.1 HDIG domain-containing protein [Bacteroidota bacterium]